MKANSSIIASFVAGAVLATLPFVLSRGNVVAQGKSHQSAVLNSSAEHVIADEEDYIYVVSKDKIFKVQKATLTVWMSRKLE